MKRVVCWIVCCAALTSQTWGMASGHEHPTGAEHPQGTSKEKAPTEIESKAALDAVAQYIRDYVQNEEPKGKVQIKDPKTGKTLSLKLDKVHRKLLAKIGPDTYFVCADFKADDGTVYDLDFFVRRKGDDEFELVKDKTSLHKVAGKPRYTWYYDDDAGVWKKKHAEKKVEEHPAAGQKKVEEHPAAGDKKAGEHPTGGAEHPH